MYSPSTVLNNLAPHRRDDHTQATANPANVSLESGDWTNSIIWDSKASFSDFTQLELNEIDDIAADYQTQNGRK